MMTRQEASAPVALDQQASKLNILISLDQATKITGYAIFINGKLEKYGHLSLTGEPPQRFVKLRNWLLDKIEKSSEYNLKIVLEEIQLQEYGNDNQRNVLTFKRLAQIQGVLLELLTEKNIEYELIYSNVWKKAAGITAFRRAEQKQQSQDHVYERYGLKVTDDEADAICLGECALGINVVTNNDFDWST